VEKGFGEMILQFTPDLENALLFKGDNGGSAGVKSHTKKFSNNL
jgi:hypothetical protein